MALTILNVAYPLAPVGPDAVGGAEQVLTHIDRGLVRAGHRSLVVACEGSRTLGTLIPTPRCPQPESHLDARAQAAHRDAIAWALARWPVDVVHLHGIDFHAYLPPPPTPTLVTLHLPLQWYPEEIFQPQRPGMVLHCVSSSQRQSAPPHAVLGPEIANGVDVDALRAMHGKRNYVVALGRICWEKGFHLALDAAARVGVGCLVAGEVFPYPAHQAYFREQIAPRLGPGRHFLGPIGVTRKRRLLTGAKALLVTSLVPETSSLVAMEALACGTPVIAFRCGALPDLIEDGRTGFLVDSAEKMSAAIGALDRIDPAICRATAAARFSVNRTVERYLALYAEMAHHNGTRRADQPLSVPAA